MSLKGKGTSAPAPLLKNASAAPFIFFDGVPVYGAAGGYVEVELAARVLMPKADGQSVGADMVCTGHLRCSPAGAAMLVDALTKALAMAAEAAKATPAELNS